MENVDFHPDFPRRRIVDTADTALNSCWCASVSVNRNALLFLDTRLIQQPVCQIRSTGRVFTLSECKKGGIGTDGPATFALVLTDRLDEILRDQSRMLRHGGREYV